MNVELNMNIYVFIMSNFPSISCWYRIAYLFGWMYNIWPTYWRIFRFKYTKYIFLQISRFSIFVSTQERYWCRNQTNEHLLGELVLKTYKWSRILIRLIFQMLLLPQRLCMWWGGLSKAKMWTLEFYWSQPSSLSSVSPACGELKRLSLVSLNPAQHIHY